MVANLSIAGVGEVVDMIMMAGMAMDAFDVGGLRQYMDNEYTYLNMRNVMEGAIFKKFSEIGQAPPYLFTLDQLKNKAMELDKDTSDSGILFNDIYQTYNEAHHTYSHISFEEGFKKIHTDPKLTEKFSNSLTNPPQQSYVGPSTPRKKRKMKL